MKLQPKYFVLFPILILLLLFTASCNTTEPPGNETFTLKLEDVSSTEAWLQLSSTNIQIPNNISLLINGSVKKTFILNTQDSLLYIDSLLPNQTYKILATMQQGNNASNELSVTTMDTTSHNFTWQTFTFGEHSSSVLYDVAIINENDIWAVGEIYMKDSLGNPDPHAFNAVHWDGSEWKIIRIKYYGNCSAVEYPPLKAIWAFSENNIVVTNGGSIGWFDGSTIILDCGVNPLLTGAINKIWGISSKDFYVVGNNGNIAHYQNGIWEKIESGTDVDLKDIYGTPEGVTVWTSGYEDFKPTVLLKISNSKIETVFNSRDYLFVFNSEHISGGIGGVWTNSNNFLYITTWYSLYRKSFYSDFSKEEALLFGNTQTFFGIRSRATDINNIFTIGSRNTVHHFNGITFRTYQEPADANFIYYSLDVKTNMSVLCGQKYENGITNKAIITLIK